MSSVACGCVVDVQIPPETLLAGFFFGHPRSIEASVIETGRGCGVVRGTVRVLGPRFKGSIKWLVAP